MIRENAGEVSKGGIFIGNFVFGVHLREIHGGTSGGIVKSLEEFLKTPKDSLELFREKLLG